MADDVPAPRRSRGCATLLAMLLLMATVAGLGAAVYFIAQPQDLDDIGGYAAGDRLAARNLRTVLENSVERGHAVTLTETEINSWLRTVLEARQGGHLSEQATLDGVRIRLNDGHAEVILERTVFGRPLTTSMFISIEQTESAQGLRTQVHLHGGAYHENLPQPTRGGRFGRLVVPQGFLLLVMPSFRSLAAEFSEEIRLGFEEMSRIRIEQDRLSLDPRPPTREDAVIPGTF
jgi:hypothetical protein